MASFWASPTPPLTIAALTRAAEVKKGSFEKAAKVVQEAPKKDPPPAPKLQVILKSAAVPAQSPAQRTSWRRQTPLLASPPAAAAPPTNLPAPAAPTPAAAASLAKLAPAAPAATPTTAPANTAWTVTRATWSDAPPTTRATWNTPAPAAPKSAPQKVAWNPTNVPPTVAVAMPTTAAAAPTKVAWGGTYGLPATTVAPAAPIMKVAWSSPSKAATPTNATWSSPPNAAAVETPVKLGTTTAAAVATFNNQLSEMLDQLHSVSNKSTTTSAPSTPPAPAVSTTSAEQQTIAVVTKTRAIQAELTVRSEDKFVQTLPQLGVQRYDKQLMTVGPRLSKVKLGSVSILPDWKVTATSGSQTTCSELDNERKLNMVEQQVRENLIRRLAEMGNQVIEEVLNPNPNGRPAKDDVQQQQQLPVEGDDRRQGNSSTTERAVGQNLEEGSLVVQEHKVEWKRAKRGNQEEGELELEAIDDASPLGFHKENELNESMMADHVDPVDYNENEEDEQPVQPKSVVVVSGQQQQPSALVADKAAAAVRPSKSPIRPPSPREEKANEGRKSRRRSRSKSKSYSTSSDRRRRRRRSESKGRSSSRSSDGGYSYCSSASRSRSYSGGRRGPRTPSVDPPPSNSHSSRSRSPRSLPPDTLKTKNQSPKRKERRKRSRSRHRRRSKRRHKRRRRSHRSSSSSSRSNSSRRHRRRRSGSSSSRATYEDGPSRDTRMDDAGCQSTPRYMCVVCNEGPYDTSKEVAQHEVTRHGALQAEFPCCWCRFRAPTTEQMLEHMLKIHPYKELSLRCGFCHEEIADRVSSDTDRGWGELRTHMEKEYLKKRMYSYERKMQSKTSVEPSSGVVFYRGGGGGYNGTSIARAQFPRGKAPCPHGPPEPCKNFPRCPGAQCYYSHGRCKKGRECNRLESCPYDHDGRDRTCLSCMRFAEAKMKRRYRERR